MKNEETPEINEHIAPRLPMWVRNRLISLHTERRDERKFRYIAEMRPFNEDAENGNVLFDANSMEDFRRQLQLYKTGYNRCGIDYMMFR
ncbi:MAG: hypothetical protein ACI4DP_00435 [Candidatus Ornithomonoglobus sp.]